MASVQTKIDFPVKKRISLSASKSNKENSSKYRSCATPLSSPSPKKPDHSVLLESNLRSPTLSPTKRLSSGGVSHGSPSPSKQKCTVSPGLNSLLSSTSLSPAKNTRAKKALFPENLSAARRALHCSAPTSLPCREDKSKSIEKLLSSCAQEERSSTMYICGPPGTGKTACLNLILSQDKIKKLYKSVYVNCTGLKSAGAVYKKIVEGLGLKKSGNTEKQCLDAILKHLGSAHKMILLVLDEMDQLDSKRQSILYSIFEWPALPDSKLVLIGIANALDLTDRVLPRLQSCGLKPELVHFPSYSKEQLSTIIRDRLLEAGVEELLDGPALQFLVRKVASVSGDVRRALDTARRVVELTDGADGQHPVTIQQVLSVVNTVYGTSMALSASSSSDNSESESFPIQQKLLICSLLLIKTHSKVKDITVGKLHDIYKKVCQKRNVSHLDLSEFISLAELVESRGVIKVQGKTKSRVSKVLLQWDHKEITLALQDKELLSSIVNDTSCLPK